MVGCLFGICFRVLHYINMHIYAHAHICIHETPPRPRFWCLLVTINLESRDLTFLFLGPQSLILWSPESSDVSQYDILSKYDFTLTRIGILNII